MHSHPHLKINNSCSKDRLFFFFFLTLLLLCLLCPPSMTESFLISKFQLNCHIFRKVVPGHPNEGGLSTGYRGLLMSSSVTDQSCLFLLYCLSPSLDCAMPTLLTTVPPGFSRNVNIFEYVNHSHAEFITVLTDGNQTLYDQDSLFYTDHNIPKYVHTWSQI